MEETLFDISGNPIAYISFDNDSTIYLWNGRPVAYLYEDMIYGFNGKHLGWYAQGEVRNLQGLICGFNKYAADVYTSYEPYKSYKQYSPYRNYMEYAHYRPVFGRDKSHETLSSFLMKGAK